MYIQKLSTFSENPSSKPGVNQAARKKQLAASNNKTPAKTMKYKSKQEIFFLKIKTQNKKSNGCCLSLLNTKKFRTELPMY